MYWLVICHALRAVEKQVLNLKRFFAKRTCLSSCIFSIYMENEDNVEGIILELYHQLQIRWMSASRLLFILGKFWFYWCQSRLQSVKSITFLWYQLGLSSTCGIEHWCLVVLPEWFGEHRNTRKSIVFWGKRRRSSELMLGPFHPLQVRIYEPGQEKKWRTGVVHRAM